MRKALTSIILSLIFFLPPSVFAHLANQQPFFKINSKYAPLYPVPVTSLSDFNLPQDLAPENYLVGQSLDFEIDLAQFGVSSTLVQSTKFFWDFGDGAKGQGVRQTHIYQKKGSYILVINADDGKTGPQLFESVLLNVLPDKNYRVPIAVIKINGKQSKDPLSDILRFNLTQGALKFDASGSMAMSSSIISYFWDFGDTQSSSEKIAEHSYRGGIQGQVFPVLRIKDANGFLADSYVNVENQVFADNSQATGTAPKKSSRSQILYAVGGLVTIFILAFALRKMLRKRK